MSMDIDQLHQRVAHLEQSLEEANHSIQEKDNTIASLTSERDIAVKAMDFAAIALKAAEHSIANATTDRDEWIAEWKGLAERCGDLVNRIATQQEQLTDAAEQNTLLTSRVEILTSQLNLILQHGDVPEHKLHDLSLTTAKTCTQAALSVDCVPNLASSSPSQGSEAVYLICVDNKQGLYEFVAPENVLDLQQHISVETYYTAPPSIKAIETAAIMSCVDLAGWNGNVHQSKMIALIIQDGLTQLEQFGMKVAEEAATFGHGSWSLPTKGQLHTIVTNLIWGTIRRGQRASKENK